MDCHHLPAVYDYSIKEYYDRYGSNPPWQKDRGGEFACPYCNLDCKSIDKLQAHDRFYHQKWPKSRDFEDEAPIVSDNHMKNFATTSSDIGNNNENENPESSKTSESRKNFKPNKMNILSKKMFQRQKALKILLIGTMIMKKLEDIIGMSSLWKKQKIKTVYLGLRMKL